MDLLENRQEISKSLCGLFGPVAESTYRYLILGSLSFAAAILSIHLSRGGEGFAIIWLPNALMIGVFWASKRRNLTTHFVMLSLGIMAANLTHGDSLPLAAVLGVSNGVELVLAALAIKYVLRFESPLKSHRHYIKFLWAVCLLPPILEAPFAATAITGLLGGSWQEVFVTWVLGDVVSILAFAPFFFLASFVLEGRASPVGSEGVKFLGCIAVLLMCLLLPLFTTAQAGQFIFATPLLAICALWLRVETVSCVAAAFLMILAVLVFFDRALFEMSVGFGDSQLLFVVAFGCMVIPANLISSVVGNLKNAEANALDASRLKSQFLATMSHEIRTPLNAIMGMFQLIERSDVAERQKLQAETGYKAATRLLRLLSDILEMSRLEARAVELWTRECSLTKLASEWQVMAEGMITGSEKQIDFSLEFLESEDVCVRADDDRLGQVVHNLVDNAVRFSQSGGMITIRVRRYPPAGENASGRIEISVSDKGCGIAKDQQELIFDRFRQTDGSIKRKVGGTGLGLAISNDLVNLMGGSLSVESELGQGAKFTISIPQNAS